MSKIIRLALLVCLAGFVMECKPPNYTQGFKTDGVRLLDYKGNPFVIRGVNNPHIWYPTKAFNALELIASKGVNCVRIVWEITGATEELEKIISQCIALGMVPMIELHDATGDSSHNELMQLTHYFIKEDVRGLLMRYQNFVLINIANEWGDNYMEDIYWYNSYKNCIEILRNAGYKTTLVIDASGWGQNISPILKYGSDLVQMDKEHNLLFSVHMYGSWNNGDKIENDLKMVYDLNLPIIVGEFGYNYQDGDNNLSCRVDYKRVLKVCNDLSYGCLAWSWTGNNKENEWLNLVEFKDWKTLTFWGNEVMNSKYGITNTAVKATVFNDQ